MAGILDDSLDMPNTSFPPPNQFSRQMSAPPPRSRNGNPDMPRPNGRDNVESIDMELSDDDANGEDRGKFQWPINVAFLITFEIFQNKN